MRRAGAGLAVLLALGCITPPLHEREWTLVSTGSFEIASSLGPAATQRLAADLDGFRAATAYVTGFELQPPAVPIRVYAFEDKGVERRFDVRGEPSYWLPSVRGSAIVLREGGGFADATLGVRHELAHELVRSHAALGVPLWYDEGLGLFLSTLRANRDRVDLGVFREDKVRLLRDSLWIPLEEILAVRELFEWTERSRATFQAQSWVFVHYLNFDERGRQRVRPMLGRYFELQSKGAPGGDAVREAFGEATGDLDRSLQGYARRDHFDEVAIRVPAASPPELRPLSRQEASVRLGWLSVELGREAQARRYFELALAGNAIDARARAGLGAADALAERNAEAEQNFEIALEIAPDDPITRLDFADFYRARAETSPRAVDRARYLTRAREHYANAARGGAGPPAAYVGYAATFLVPGQEAAQGLEAARFAEQRLPASLEVQLLLARLHARAGEAEAARRIAAAVEARAHRDPELSTARRLLSGEMGLPRQRKREILK
jgi:tetratricopeptide (TPR) repeat protein